jgi:tryptophan-rich sensory protein
MNIESIPKLIISIIVCEIVGASGSIFTFPNIPTWYSTLTKPFFSPPNWLFGPVWTFLFLLMGISFYLIWVNAEKKLREQKNVSMSLFGVQYFFNVLWSYLFFGLRSPLLGLIGIIILWILIVLTIINFYKISKTSAYLLVPYLLWVSFATILNLSIMILNP